jgi:hypothetical protein
MPPQFDETLQGFIIASGFDADHGDRNSGRDGLV